MAALKRLRYELVVVGEMCPAVDARVRSVAGGQVGLEGLHHGGGDGCGGRVRAAGPVGRRGPGVAEPASRGLPWVLLLLLLLLLLALLLVVACRPRPHGAHRASRANAQPRRQALQHSHPAIGDPR